MELTIDGKTVHAAPGQSVLDAARGAFIPVPTLCHHPAVAPDGNCRLCVVELRAPRDPSTRVAPSCLEPAKEGLEVQTRTPLVRRVRRTVLALLLARSPGSPLLRSMARENDVDLELHPATGEQHGCVLCGLCVRVCDQSGYRAISLQKRGERTEVAGPFGLPPEDCVGCAACAHVCPTSHLEVEQAAGQRSIWGRSFELARCVGCGTFTLPVAQLQHAAAKLGLPAGALSRCGACNWKATGLTFERVMAAAGGASPAAGGAK